MVDRLCDPYHISPAMNTQTPNHALQRTRAAVTAPASCLRLSPAAQGPRQPRPSLTLGSLGVSSRLLKT